MIDGDNITGTTDPNQVNAGRDLIFGDNVELNRIRAIGIGANALGDFTDTRFRLLDPETGQLYGSALNIDGTTNVVDGEALFNGDDADPDDAANPTSNQHFAFGQLNPDGAAVWADFDINLLDHDLTTEEAAGNNFGNDYIAGGGEQDMIFGQLGGDVIQGDGGITSALGITPAPVGASRSDPSDADGDGALGALDVTASFEADSDDDDYIEGNGGDDVIFGNLGQDDIIGDNSDLFSLTSLDEREPVGTDIIFGGAGIRIDRNEYVEDLGLGDDGAEDILIENRHARDSDMILGDNGRIIRMVENGTGTSFLEFEYDSAPDTTTQGEHYHPNNPDLTSYDGSRGDERIVVRVADLLDYTFGGPDGIDQVDNSNDLGQADEIHGESGDDFLYGQVGKDTLFGDSDDDDIIGGYGHDWISGGTGQDGVIGGDGRIFTSRNVDSGGGQAPAFSEPLYGILPVDTNEFISTPGKIQQATIHLDGELKKTVDLTPFFPVGVVLPTVVVDNSTDDNDIIFGGLGSDFLHGGFGSDAISGAEAISSLADLFPYSYHNPGNPGDILNYGSAPGRPNEFAAYDEFNPRPQVFVDPTNGFVFADPMTNPNAVPFVLNFDSQDGAASNDRSPQPEEDGIFRVSDGNDLIFGDMGHDWLVGGTGRDRIYGGFGDDMLNADDVHDDPSDPLNETPDTANSYADIAYGGAGRDILIANTGGDRMIDWVGEFNSYIVPFAPFGAFTISRSMQPHVREFLYDLSAADGTDFTRIVDGDAARNGEPFGELGVVVQQDAFWHDQTGGPDDPQPGNIPGGPRDTMAAEDFNSAASLTPFAADTGSWTLEAGKLVVAPENLGEDAVSVYHIEDVLPAYFELVATINGGKPTAGLKSNAYLIFDYQSPTDFKFAGVNISIDKLQIGHRTAEGWTVDVQTPSQLKPNRDYNVKVAVNGTTVTVLVDGTDFMTHVFEPRIVNGFAYGINAGMVGLGSENSIARLDNLSVQVLPPDLTFEQVEDFTDNVADLFTGLQTGAWNVQNGSYVGQPAGAGLAGYSLLDLSGELGLAANSFYLQPNSILKLGAELSTDKTGGFIFDYVNANRFKFTALDPNNNQVIVGYYTAKDGWVIDAAADFNLKTGTTYELMATLKGSTISVQLDGQTVLGHAFNSVLVDGNFGVLTEGGLTYFDKVSIETDDPAFRTPEDAKTMMAASSQTDPAEVMSDLTYADLDPIIGAAVNRWTESSLFDEEMLSRLDGVTFLIADLAGDALALAVDDTVIIDVDAAGHGWFVDDTPYQDTEYMPQNSDEELTANETSDAYGDMDLLTVVMHELGHVYGYQDMDPETNDTEIMNKTLDEGVRYLPEDTFTNQAQDNSDSLISMDLTPDESAARDTLNTLVNDNPWLIQYLVDGATGGTDPNGNIAVIIDDEETQNDSGDASDDTTSNPGNGNGNKK
jgi:Ca2+-binding RTX toxin-like protein